MSRSGVRISGGRFRGRNLVAGARTRPTSSRLREALLDTWQDRVVGARLLDLFAGTGAVGLEALSRGAGFVVFVESSRQSARRLRTVCDELAPESTVVIQARLPAQIGHIDSDDERRFDLVFADPPYEFSGYQELLKAIQPLLDQNGEVAIEHSRRKHLPESGGGLVRRAVRDYGESRLSYYTHNPACAARDAVDQEIRK
jgi:16S rRNA (guanine966-N2)-methyltransferase